MDYYCERCDCDIDNCDACPVCEQHTVDCDCIFCPNPDADFCDCLHVDCPGVDMCLDCRRHLRSCIC